MKSLKDTETGQERGIGQVFIDSELHAASQVRLMNRLSMHMLIHLTRVAGIAPLLWLFWFLQFSREGSGGLPAMAFNAILLILWSTFHSLLARDRIKAVIARVTGSDSIRAIYVITSGITLALVLYCWKPLAGVLWNAQGAGYWILTGLFLACIGGAYWTARFFDTSDFIGIRVYVRRLRNKPQKAQRFSANGPYAYCRHPMYLFFIASLWIGPTMTYGRFEFALLGTAYIIIGTYLEERNLRAELGREYDAYRANVPMWIPRLRPWKYDWMEGAASVRDRH